MKVTLKPLYQMGGAKKEKEYRINLQFLPNCGAGGQMGGENFPFCAILESEESWEKMGELPATSRAGPLRQANYLPVRISLSIVSLAAF
jgi:hypothetical protein